MFPSQSAPQKGWGRGFEQEVTTGEGICHVRSAVHMAGTQLYLTTTAGCSPETGASENSTVCFKINMTASQRDLANE